MAAFEAEIARCPIFLEMSFDECQEVLELARVETIRANQTILQEGHLTQTLWIVLRGRCEVLKTAADGKEQQLGVLGRGALFGEMSFFHPVPHPVSVRALGHVQLLSVSQDQYRQLERSGSKAASKLAASIARMLAERLRRMDEWIFQFVQLPGVADHHAEYRAFRTKLYSDWQS